MKSTTRRWATILTAAGLTLAGCGSTTPDVAGPSTQGLPTCPVEAIKSASGPVDVLLWYQLSAKTGETLKSQIDKYNRSQDKVRVRAEQQGSSYEELFSAYQRGVTSKTLPDIAVMEETTTQYMVDSKTVLPAQSCYETDKIPLDGFNKNAVKYYTVGGVFYPATASLSDIVTYYNKNHYRRAGLDPDKPPATLAEVRAHAQKLKAAGVTDKPVILKLAPWFIETQLTGSKQPVVDNDNGHGSGQTTKALFGTDTTTGIIEWIQQMINDKLLTPVPDTSGQFDHYLGMARQTASITIETSTAATSIKAFLAGDSSVGESVGANPATGSLDKLDVGAGPVFGVKEAGKAQIGGNAFWIMNTSAPEKQSAAWDFMKWWNQIDQQVTWHTEGSYLPFVNATVDDPRVQSYWKDDAAGKVLKVAYDELTNGIDPSFPGPLIGPFADFRNSLRNAIDSVAFAKSATPSEAVAKSVQEVNDAIAQYNETNF